LPSYAIASKKNSPSRQKRQSSRTAWTEIYAVQGETLLSTQDLKSQLSAVGSNGTYSEAEIMPEYVREAKHETLKTLPHY
jgi:hypothetical protein